MHKVEDNRFVPDYDLSIFKSIFGNDEAKEIHMDTYLKEPSMLLSRVVEKNISPSWANNRFILRKKDKTVLVNIPIEDIEDCIIRQYAECNYIAFEIHNIVYRILATF